MVAIGGRHLVATMCLLVALPSALGVLQPEEGHPIELFDDYVTVFEDAGLEFHNCRVLNLNPPSRAAATFDVEGFSQESAYASLMLTHINVTMNDGDLALREGLRCMAWLPTLLRDIAEDAETLAQMVSSHTTTSLAAKGLLSRAAQDIRKVAREAGDLRELSLSGAPGSVSEECRRISDHFGRGWQPGSTACFQGRRVDRDEAYAEQCGYCDLTSLINRLACFEAALRLPPVLLDAGHSVLETVRASLGEHGALAETQEAGDDGTVPSISVTAAHSQVLVSLPVFCLCQRGIHNHGHMLHDNMFPVFRHLFHYRMLDTPMVVLIGCSGTNDPAFNMPAWQRLVVETVVQIITMAVRVEWLSNEAFARAGCSSANGTAIDMVSSDRYRFGSLENNKDYAIRGIIRDIRRRNEQGGFEHNYLYSSRRRSPALRMFVNRILDGLQQADTALSVVKATIVMRQKRYFLNHEELAKTLARSGYEVSVVRLEQTTLSQQVKWYRSSNLMLMPMGAQLANAIFMHAGSTVMVFWPNPDIRKFFAERGECNHMAANALGVAIQSVDKPFYDAGDEYMMAQDSDETLAFYGVVRRDTILVLDETVFPSDASIRPPVHFQYPLLQVNFRVHLPQLYDFYILPNTLGRSHYPGLLDTSFEADSDRQGERLRRASECRAENFLTTGSSRTDLINTLSGVLRAESYLEVGVRDGSNFYKVDVPRKLAVDHRFPWLVDGYNIHHETSDAFFQNLAVADAAAAAAASGGGGGGEKFDMIFINGDHHARQVYKDILNALDRLAEGGLVICHDMNPQSFRKQSEPYKGRGAWNGAAWKAWVMLRTSRPDLRMAVIDMDEGCGIIAVGRQEVYVDEGVADRRDMLSYGYLQDHRRDVLNLLRPGDMCDFFSPT
mmetsp:Transcript_19905/g.38719  ORF Transcript_19905/g.38719 Transcript_19905/m.38719 type:complete len:896 (-) Transcript_19905:8-2695(-)